VVAAGGAAPKLPAAEGAQLSRLPAALADDEDDIAPVARLQKVGARSLLAASGITGPKQLIVVNLGRAATIAAAVSVTARPLDKAQSSSSTATSPLLAARQRLRVLQFCTPLAWVLPVM
jgi:hypothetical protein